MKTLLAILCLTGALLQTARCAYTNGLSFNLQTLRGTYDWAVSAERILATPEWIPKTQAIPLAPDKACQLAKDWLKKHDFSQFELETFQLFRYPAPYVGNPGEKLRRRFYYRIEYQFPHFAMMYVYVLLDGTVLEPTLSPPAKKKK